MQTIAFIIVAILAAVFVQLGNMNKLNRKFTENNQEFRNDKYWRAEKFSILGTLCVIVIFCIGFPYAVIEYKLSTLIQFLSYAIVGGVGNSVFIYLLGRSEKKLKNLIDKQTNTGE